MSFRRSLTCTKSFFPNEVTFLGSGHSHRLGHRHIILRLTVQTIMPLSTTSYSTFLKSSLCSTSENELQGFQSCLIHHLTYLHIVYTTLQVKKQIFLILSQNLSWNKFMAFLAQQLGVRKTGTMILRQCFSITLQPFRT